MGIDESELPNIERGALLHDIGKLGILDEILLKKGELSETEWHEIEKHPVIAKDLLSGVNLLKDAIDIPFSHHENWDGSGYPQGLRGKRSPRQLASLRLLKPMMRCFLKNPTGMPGQRKKQ